MGLQFSTCNGSTGEASQPGEDDVVRQEQELVRLNVYDVVEDPRLTMVNEIFRPMGAGAYHAGVEVYGLEWSFGHKFGAGSGVFSCQPRQNNTVGKFREAVVLGSTELSSMQVLEILARLEQEWPGEGYDLVSRNCIHFCEEFATAIGARSVPRWVTSWIGAGAMLRDSAVAAKEALPSLFGTLNAGAGAVQGLTSAVDVVLECTASSGGDLSQLQPHERSLTVRVSPGRPQKIGPNHQREHFARFLPGSVGGSGGDDGGDESADAIGFEATGADGELFVLEWEPPCLFLRKPNPRAALRVGGTPIRRLTYILLNNSQIGVCPHEGAEAALVFRLERKTAVSALKSERLLSALPWASRSDPAPLGAAPAPLGEAAATASAPPSRSSRPARALSKEAGPAPAPASAADSAPAQALAEEAAGAI